MNLEKHTNALRESMEKSIDGRIGRTASEKWLSKAINNAFPQRTLTYLAFHLRRALTPIDGDPLAVYQMCSNLTENLMPDTALMYIELEFRPGIQWYCTGLSVRFHLDRFHPQTYHSLTRITDRIDEDTRQPMTGERFAEIAPLLLQVFKARPRVKRLNEVVFTHQQQTYTLEALEEWLRLQFIAHDGKPWKLTMSQNAISFNDQECRLEGTGFSGPTFGMIV